MSDKSGNLTRFIKTSGIFLAGTALSKLVLFLLLPYYTATLPTGDFGYYDLSVAFVTVAASALFFDIWITTMRFLYLREDALYRRGVVRSGFTLFLYSIALYAVAAGILALSVSPRYLGWIALYGLFQSLSNLFAYAARGYGRNVDFAVSGILCSVVLLGVTVVLISVLHFDFSALYIAGIAGYVVQIVYLELRVGVLRGLGSAPPDRAQLREMARYTLPLLLNAVGFWLINSFNKFAVTELLTTSGNGIFAVAEKLAALISFAVICFTNAWQDLSFSQKNTDENKGAFYADACRTYLVFLAMCVVLLLPLIKLVFPYLIGDDYADASLIIPLAVTAAAISGYSLFLGNIFYALGDTKTLLYTTLAGSALNLALCWPLIHFLGLNGANLSMIVSFAFVVVLRNVLLKKRIGFRAHGGTSLIALGGIAAASVVYYRLSVGLNMVFFAVCLILFGAIALRALKRLYTKSG